MIWDGVIPESPFNAETFNADVKMGDRAWVAYYEYDFMNVRPENPENITGDSKMVSFKDYRKELYGIYLTTQEAKKAFNLLKGSLIGHGDWKDGQYQQVINGYKQIYGGKKTIPMQMKFEYVPIRRFGYDTALHTKTKNAETFEADYTKGYTDTTQKIEYEDNYGKPKEVIVQGLSGYAGNCPSCSKRINFPIDSSGLYCYDCQVYLRPSKGTGMDKTLQYDAETFSAEEICKTYVCYTEMGGVGKDSDAKRGKKLLILMGATNIRIKNNPTKHEGQIISSDIPDDWMGMVRITFDYCTVKSKNTRSNVQNKIEWIADKRNPIHMNKRWAWNNNPKNDDDWIFADLDYLARTLKEKKDSHSAETFGAESEMDCREAKEEVKKLRRKIALLDKLYDKDNALHHEILGSGGFFKEHELKGLFSEKDLENYEYWS